MRRRQDVESDGRVSAGRAQRAHQSFAEMAGAAGDEEFHVGLPAPLAVATVG
jgi:hypothetical protein